MGLMSWYSANLQYDGITLSRIDSGEIVIDFTSRLWKNASKTEKERAIMCQVEKNMEDCIELKNLGWENGWVEYPPEVKACREANHKREWTSDYRRCVSKVVCPICNYYYQVDSSG